MPRPTRVLALRPLRTVNQKNSGAPGQRIALTILSPRGSLTRRGLDACAARADHLRRALAAVAVRRAPRSPSRLHCVVVVHLTSSSGRVPVRADDSADRKSVV